MKTALQQVLTLGLITVSSATCFPRQLTPSTTASLEYGAKTQQVSKMRQAPSYGEIITTPPAGETRNYYRDGKSYGLNFSAEDFAMMLELNDDQYVIGRVVETERGDVYLLNPVITYNTGAYIKGRHEGNEYVFSLPQPITEIDDMVVGVSMMTLAEDPDMGITGVPVTENNEVRFTVNADGTLTQKKQEGKFLGYYYMDDDSWSFMGTPEQTYYPFNEKAVEFPAGATAMDGQMIYGDRGRKVRYAIDGDNFYLGGLYDGGDDCWAKGVIEGDKVTFPSYAYLGASEIDYHYIFFVGAAAAAVESDNIKAYESISFYYDAKTSTLTPMREDDTIIINASAKEIYWLAYYTDPNIRPFELMPATPKNPVIDSFEQDPDYGYSMLNFILSALSTDGNLLDRDHYFYNLIMDDEVFEFYPDEYASLSEMITDLPADFSDGEDIYVTEDGIHSLMIYTEGFEKIGVQAVYKVDGVENRSAVVYADNSGIENMEGANAAPIAREYFNLCGYRVKAGTPGILLERSVYADGSVKSRKVIVR